MAVGLIIQFAGIGPDKYEAVMKALGLTGNKGDWPKGIVSHMAGATPEGWCVVDVWESQGDFDAFFNGRLKPAFDKVGDLPPPRITTVAVHNTYRHG